MQTTSSPLSTKGGGGGSSASFRPRDPEVSFTTFRGESPCSFRFDSDNDTLTRAQRRGSNQHHPHPYQHPHSNPRASPLSLSSSHPLQPHARSLHSLAGGSSGSSRPLLPSYSGRDSASSDEAQGHSSLGRRTGVGPRRAITPGADLARHGYAPSLGLSSSTPSHEHLRGGPRYGENPDHHGRTPAGLSTFAGGNHYADRDSVAAAPPVEVRGRNILGPPSSVSSSASRLQVPEYVNAYSDLDSGDDSRLEPGEDDLLLPPYPEALEEREEEGDEEDLRRGNVSERSALNFVPGLTNLSRTSEDSFRTRRSSEV